MMAGNKSLIEIIEEHLNTDAMNLPVYPAIALELQTLLGKDNCSMSQVAGLISKDQSLSSQVLRIANSAFFAGLSKASTLKNALVRLGTQQVLSCVMVACQRDHYRSNHGFLNAFMKELWKHALCCAIGTKWFVKRIGYNGLDQEAFLAGLLHDIGKLFLLKVMDSIMTSKEYDIRISRELLLEILANMHAECGYRLLQTWNVPEIYCEIARDHHQEPKDSSAVLLLCAQTVNQACRKLGIGINSEPSIVLAGLPEVNLLKANEIVLAEMEIMLEDAMALDA
jgi:HD-like signal output (HDOD) protein